MAKEDIKYMRIAIELAKRGVGTTFPNPSVGCVIVNNGIIVAASFTQPEGKTHAEVSAIQKAFPESLKGATMYVTLEPCSHFGKSPPCVNSLIPSGIKKVVIANQDENPKVSGGGIKVLKEAGIDVEVGVLADEAMEVNYPFFRSITKKLPFVTFKAGMSLDGKIALSNGKSKWVTCPVARHYSQMLRYRNDAIIVGSNTVLRDDPELTLRIEGLEKYSPLRVIIGKENIPSNSRILQEQNKARTLVFTGKNDNLDLREVLAELADMGVCRILLEGGQNLATSFLKENLIDEIQAIISPKIFGAEALSVFGNLGISEIAEGKFKLKETSKIGECFLVAWLRSC